MMMTKDIKQLFLAGVMGCGLSTLIIACSDAWDDHYDETSVPQQAEGSLWEAIKGNDQLSNFSRVIEATGYDKALASNQVFTVFAPTNDALSAAEAETLIGDYKKEKAANVKDQDNLTIKEFVQNHIALYNHSVSQHTDTSVMMMNGKYLDLSYSKLGKSDFLTKNELKSNGLLYTLRQKAEYFDNIYEYLLKDAELDSTGNFLKTFTRYEFLPMSSVPGGIIDGRTWYIDSVFVQGNILFEKDRAAYSPFMGNNETMGKINSEDSTYWMVAPTNDVWNTLVPQYEKYFNYDDMVEHADSLRWFYTRMGILGGTVFSESMNLDRSGNWNKDSVMSVNSSPYAERWSRWGDFQQKYFQYDKPFDEGGIFTGVTEVDCSNGKVLKASNWKHDKRQGFYQDIMVEAENRNYIASYNEKTTNYPSVESVTSEYTDFFGKVSNKNQFLFVTPSGVSQSEITFKLPNLLSEVGYDIYVVFVPGIANDAFSPDTVPVKFGATYNYHEQDGDYMNSDIKLYKPGEKTLDFVTNPNAIDTVLIAENLSVPTSSFGLSPQFLLTLKSRLRSSERQTHTYTANMRIDFIILKPHEDETDNKNLD